MRRIESIKDDMDDVVTYEFPNGEQIRVAGAMVRECGPEVIMRRYYHGGDKERPQGRLPVFQRGRQIGSVPEWFDPRAIRSTSFFYDPRPGDFRLDGDKWIADDMLGPGDLEAIPGFIRERE